MHNKISLADRVKSVFYPLFGPPTELATGISVPSGFARSANTGQNVSADSALKISAVWACVRLIAGTISTLPLGIYQKNADGSKRPNFDHPAHDLISLEPNPDVTAAQFWESLMLSVLLWGDGFAEIKRIGSRPVILNFLPTSRMTRTLLTNGVREYRFSELDGTQRVISAANLLRVPGLSANGIDGVSVLQYAANTFGSAQAANESAGKVYEQGMTPGGFLQIDKFLTAKQREDARANLVTNFAGSANSGKTLLLEGGMKFEALSLSPADAQLLESRKFDIEEICRIFSVPPFMVGHAEKSTTWGTGIEQQMLGFLTFSLRPWLVRITQAVGRSLLTPTERKTLFAQFDVNELLKGDHAAKAAFYAAMAQNGIYTRNELRNAEGLADLAGGDSLTVQSNLVPLEKLGALGGQPTLPGKLRAVGE